MSTLFSQLPCFHRKFRRERNTGIRSVQNRNPPWGCTTNSARRQGLTLGMWFTIQKITVRIGSPNAVHRLARKFKFTVGPLDGAADQSLQVRLHRSAHANFRIPQINLSPPSSTDKQEHEDWKVSLIEFQEWLGLACIGSQR